MVLRLHGDERVDDWFWLRERENPEVRTYLEAENAYTDAATAHTRELQEQLFAEFKHRVVETDATVPARKGEFWYYRRTVEGLEYTIHCRRHGSEEGPEQVLLDENELAAGQEYLDVNLAVSPDGRMLAYAVDTTGGERFTLRVRDLETGSDLEEEIADVYYGLAWANDSRNVFYTRPDKAMRPWQVWRHELGAPAGEDSLVVQEEDDRYFVDVTRTRSDRFLVITFESIVTTEVRVIPADDPAAAPRVVVPRREGVEGRVEDAGDRLLVLTNEDAADFRLLDEDGEKIVPEHPGVRLAGVTALAGRLVLSERTQAIQRLRVGDAVLEQPEEAYTAVPGANLEFDSDVFRFQYTSLVTPETTVDVELESLERRERKQVPVRDYDPSEYVSERLWARAEDGTRVPVSIVRRRDRPAGGPLLLYGYGSYEIPILPSFSAFRLSLLDRGFAWAIAHIRGGGELGRHWYEDGKLAQKRNTFTDFIACAELLIRDGWTTPTGLVARGGSAGGLLMGAVVNMRPDLFTAVVAEVPFVDTVTTMLDDSIPLTTIEWDEWGDPRQREFYEVMKAYSPYDNVNAKAYPRMLVTAGLNDPRVAYWEPAKWVAKLRATKTDSNPLLLKTQLGAGHAGPSARYDAWRQEAFVYAFVLDAVGLA
jgi:oligopeptidase B